MAEEEVQGGVKVRVQPDEQDDEQSSSTVVRCMPRNRTKNMPCCSGQMWSPKRRNSDTQLWLSLLMLLFPLWEMRNGKCLELSSTKHNSYHMVTWFLRVTVSVYRQVSLHCTYTLKPHPVWGQQ